MQLFHGTHFECNFTTKSTARLCRKDCEGCSIVKQSFKMECVGKIIDRQNGNDWDMASTFPRMHQNAISMQELG
ncbi:hypothetical protein BDF19DRAFT_456925 [Syncephalis fuscata]|nr:hypothetical protein BDF19DRAFT_456925 [Syncephalis fuscata]